MKTTNMPPDNNQNITIPKENVRYPKWMKQIFTKCCTTNDSLVILDCRSPKDFKQGHVKSAISIHLPELMMRRLRKGCLAVKNLIASPEVKEKLSRQHDRTTIIVYDKDSSYNSSAKAPVSSSGSQSPIGLIVARLIEDGCTTYFISGGFISIESQFPEVCETATYNNIPSDDPNIISTSFTQLSITHANSEPDLIKDHTRSRNLLGCSFQESGPSTPTTPTSFPVQILPYLFLGCAKDAMNSENLERFGIKYILNVTPNLPNQFEDTGSYKYKQIPIDDHWSENLSQFFPEAIEFIDEARQATCGVLVHCLAGVSRSVTVTVAYIMHKLNMSLNEAYDYVKKRKSNISPNFTFMGQLLDFEHTLSEQRHPCGSKSGETPGKTMATTASSPTATVPECCGLSTPDSTSPDVNR